MQNTLGGSKLEIYKEHFQRWLDGENPGPLVCEIGAVRGCNHACVHCGFQQFQKYEDRPHFLHVAAGKRFLEDFKSLGGVEVFFAGNGEPLLHPDLPELIRHAAAQGLAVTLSTNGALLDADVAEAILPSLKWLRVSLNGGNAAVYASVHRCPPGDFDRVRQNIAAAAAIRDRLGSPARIAMQFVAFRPNIASIPDAARLHAAVGSDVLSIRDVFFRGRDQREPDPDLVAAIRAVEGLPGVENRCALVPARRQAASWRFCRGIHFRTNLDDQGNLFTCNRHLVEDRVYGNIVEQSFRDIWASSRRRRVFEEVAGDGPSPLCQEMCQVALDNRYIAAHAQATGGAQ